MMSWSLPRMAVFGIKIKSHAPVMAGNKLLMHCRICRLIRLRFTAFPRFRLVMMPTLDILQSFGALINTTSGWAVVLPNFRTRLKSTFLVNRNLRFTHVPASSTPIFLNYSAGCFWQMEFLIYQRIFLTWLLAETVNL